MTAIITPAGRAWLATQQANPTGKTIATVKFLDGVDAVVHTASVTSAGFVSPDMVSYGVILESAQGTFTFEKLEFYSDDAAPVKVLEDTVQVFTKQAGGLSWSHATLLKYSDVASITNITVPAETWQLNFEGHFQNVEADARAAVARILGRFAALNDAFKVAAPLPTVVDALDVVGSWTLSGGSGGITVDAADKVEGAASLEVAGHVVDAQFSLDFGAPVDWSADNGVVARARSAGAATNIIFFLEDGIGNRNEWNIVSQTPWTEHEIDLTAPDVNGGTDYSNVKIMGWGGLDAGVTYYFDAVERLRFNDFTLAAGDGFLEGVFLQPVATQYSDHLLDWNGDAAAVPTVLAPPGGGTRTDGVWLDIHLLPGADGPTPVTALTVGTAARNDFVDGNGFQHYLEKLADIARDTGERITTAMVTDKRRQVQFASDVGAAMIPPPGRNAVINGRCIVAQRAAVTLGAGHAGIANRVFGKVDRIAGFTTQTATAGLLTQSASAPVGTTGHAIHFSGVSLPAGGKLHFLYRMEANDAARSKGGKVSISCKVYHDAGAPKNLTLYLRGPDVADVFSAVTAIADNGGTSVADATETTVKWENVDLAAANPERGLELEIELDCGAIVTKNFYLTELQIEAGAAAMPLEPQRFSWELAGCLRYFEKSYNSGVEPGAASTLGRAMMTNIAPTGNARVVLVNNSSYKVRKRAIPTVTFYDAADGTVNQIHIYNAALTKRTVSSKSGVADTHVCEYLQLATGITAGDYYVGHWTADAEL